jgi:hypothetical protein
MSIVCSTFFIHVLKSLGDRSMCLKLSELMDSDLHGARGRGLELLC